MNRLSTITLIAVLTCGLGGCRREEPTETRNTAVQPAVAQPSASGAQVARIVFVDLDKCCACTRDRIDAAWKVLTDILGFPPTIDVERIHMDTHEEKARPYTSKRPVMVPPGIYFLDGQGALVEMLQGEVKPEQVKRVLGPVTGRDRSG